MIEKISSWVFWFVVALAAGYAWAASSYLPKIEYLETQVLELEERCSETEVNNSPKYMGER